MTVDNRIKELKAEIEELEGQYCSNCQEWDCDICWREILEEDDK